MSWFSRYPEKKVEIGENLRSGVIRLEWVDQKVEDAAWSLFREKADRRFSLTDCTSFILMDRLGVMDVFTFDRDFRRLEKYNLRPGQAPRIFAPPFVSRTSAPALRLLREFPHL